MRSRSYGADAVQGRCLGLLLGLAAGDRNGGPIRMAVRLAESLHERGAFDAADISSRYVEWWREGAIDTGPVSGSALELMASGLSHRDASVRVHQETGGRTAGCNPSHRSSPLAMAAYLPDEALPEVAAAEARLTHLDPLAGDAAATIAVLCRLLIRGVPWDEALERAAEQRMAETRHALRTARAGPGTAGGFSPEVLRAAVHFTGSRSGFVDALESSLAFAGPANYCPVLVGALSGARWGASAIPPHALGDVTIIKRVRWTGDALASDWAVR